MNRLKRIIANSICLVSLCVFPILGSSQNISNENGPKEIIGHPLNGIELHMDGIVDETFWLKIPGNGNFLMQEPKEGGEPTEQTEVRVAFDSQNIYIAVICHDSNPSDIKAFQKRGMHLWKRMIVSDGSLIRSWTKGELIF